MGNAPGPVIVFPSAEAWAIDYLIGTMPTYGYPSLSIVQKRTTARTEVWVRRDGGPVLDLIREAPRLTVNVFAPSEKEADDLSRVVGAVLRAGAGSGPVKRVRQTAGPALVDDPAGPRRLMSFDLIVRGTSPA